MKFPQGTKAPEKETLAPKDDQGARVLLTAAMAHALLVKNTAMSAIPRQAVELADQLLRALDVDHGQ